jgi:hypothetical protein
LLLRTKLRVESSILVPEHRADQETDITADESSEDIAGESLELAGDEVDDRIDGTWEDLDGEVDAGTDEKRVED